MLHEVVRANDVDGPVCREDSSAAPGADEGIRGEDHARAVDRMPGGWHAPHRMAAAPKKQAPVAACARALAGAAASGKAARVGE